MASLTREVVGKVLTSLGVTWTFSPYGFELGKGLRLESGGGIAGMLRDWWIVDVATGKQLSPRLIRALDLRRAVRGVGLVPGKPPVAGPVDCS